MKTKIAESIFCLILGTAVIYFWYTAFTYTDYYKCDRCDAAYRQVGFEHGLPGRYKYICPCGGRIIRCSKQESGWIDGKPANLKGR